MTAQDVPVGDVPVRALRVTFVGELGWELYAPAEYGRRCGSRCWGPGEGTVLPPAATGRSRACASRRGTGCGARTSRPRRRPTRRASASASSSASPAGSSARRRSAGSRRRACGAGCACLVLDDPRDVVLGGEPVPAGVDGGGVRRAGHVGRLRLVARRLDRLRLPAPRGRRRRHPARGRPVRGATGRDRHGAAAVRPRGAARPRLRPPPTIPRGRLHGPLMNHGNRGRDGVSPATPGADGNVPHPVSRWPQ